MRSAHVLLLVAAFLQTQAGALATVRWNDALDVGALGSAAAGHQQVLSAGSSKNAASPVVSQDSYEGHQVWRFDLNSMTAEEQRDFLRRIEVGQAAFDLYQVPDRMRRTSAWTCGRLLPPTPIYGWTPNRWTHWSRQATSRLGC